MENTNKDRKFAELEALLFVHGEPLSVDKIAKALGFSSEDAKNLIEEYRDALRGDARGVLLAFDGSGKKVQLITKPEFSHVLEQFVKEELREDLTPASLETLSIVAYLGPILRSEIEYLRGVNSSFILRNLLIRGLIEREAGAIDGGAMHYSPSMECLRYLGVSSREELPEFDMVRSAISSVERGSASGAGDNDFQDSQQEKLH